MARVASPDHLLGELQSALERAGQLLEELKARPPASAAAGAATARPADLAERLAAAEADLGELSTRLVDAERQRGRLMNLYVATYQLHATLDLDEVKSTIAEIVRELLGAERFVLLLREGETVECEVALARGLDGEQGSPFAGRHYRGGDPAVDRTLADGVLRMDPDEGSASLAAVPLRVQGMTVGVIVILKLFDHKPSLDTDDRDLLDLLAAHAASALVAARIYSTTDRKLRTLESLIQLVRGG